MIEFKYMSKMPGFLDPTKH